MKIAHIGLRGVPAEYSGIERAVEELGSRLAKKGHDITVYCMSGRYGKKTDSYKGMKLVYIPTIKSKNFEMVVYASMATLSGSLGNYDLCHFHALGPSTFSFIPRMAGKKTVVTVQGLDWKRGKWSWPARSYLKLGEKSSIYFPHRTIVVSKTLKHYYEDKYKRPVRYLPNGINRPETIVPRNLGEKFPIQPNKYLLFVGRLSREKNVHLLIEAFKKTKTSMKLLIVGGSTHTNDYEAEIKASAREDKRILWAGPVYDDLLPHLYANAFLFILPSDLEGLPVVLLEALSYGNTVLTSNIPENVEILQDGPDLCGFVFDAGRVDSLERMLTLLTDNPQKVESLKGRGKFLVRDRYDWDAITDHTEALYQELLKTT